MQIPIPLQVFILSVVLQIYAMESIPFQLSLSKNTICLYSFPTPCFSFVAGQPAKSKDCHGKEMVFCAVHSFRKLLLHSIKLSKALYGTLFSFSMFPFAFPFHLLYSFSAIGNFTNTFIPHNSHSAWISAIISLSEEGRNILW